MNRLSGTKRDNSTATGKHRLRRRVLAECNEEPTVLETHGGWGRAFERVWYRTAPGMVIEKDEDRCAHLAQQRPTWSVYQADSTAALAAGLGQSRRFDIVDIDPWGMALPVLDAFMTPQRAYPDRWHLVVNDGGRLKMRVAGAWHVKRIAHIVQRIGNDIHRVYLEVLQQCVTELADSIGFAVTHFEGSYQGDAQVMTHFWARLDRRTTQ